MYKFCTSYFLKNSIILFSLGFAIEKATNFFKEIKSGSAKLAKGFEAKLSIVPVDSKKSEVSATNTNSTNDNLN